MDRPSIAKAVEVTKEICGNHPDKDACIDDLADVWQKAKSRGLLPRQFAALLFPFTCQILINFVDWRDGQRAAQYMQKACVRLDKIFSRIARHNQ